MGERQTTGWWYLCSGLAACTLVLLLPRSHATDVLAVLIALSAPAAGIVGTRRRHRSRRAWWWLVAGSTLIALGEVAELALRWTAPEFRTETSVDLLFLAGYTVQLIGLMALLRGEVVSAHRFGWFDATAIGIAAGVVVWTVLFRTVFGDRDLNVVDLTTRFGGAIIGIGLFAMSNRLVAGFPRRGRGFDFLLAGLSLQFAFDCLAALWSGATPGSRVDAGWLVGYVMIGAAYATTERAEPARDAPTRAVAAEIRHSLTLQSAVMVVLAGVIVVEAGAHMPLASLVVWSVAWFLVALITRLRVAGLLRLVGEASATENQLRLSAMVASSQDVIGLADPDGTVRYMSPAISGLTGDAPDAWIGRRFDQALGESFAGLDDLGYRVAAMGPGEQCRWDCTLRAHGGHNRTLQLTIANQVDLPEVRGWVLTMRDVTEQTRLTSELRHQALHDTLTGLPNRALLFDRIQHTIDRMQRTESGSVAVVLIDIDDFKAVNDSLGHAAGDELLQATADRLQRTMRHGDTVARLGGDEFAILLEDTDEETARMLARRSLDNLSLPVSIGSTALAVRASAGVVCTSRITDDTDPVDLLRAADIAMYASKRHAKSTVTVFHPSMHELAVEELELRMDLNVALERREFRVLYQPIVRTGSGAMIGAEALLRWVHPTRGVVGPTTFIPIAEQSGQIVDIGTWVLRTACAEAATWPSSAYISVNVSVPQLHAPGFADVVRLALRDSGLEPKRLLLEITESMAVDGGDRVRATLDELRGAGIRVAIDDFGTGYSSLASLGEISADVLKIDRSFVQDLDSRADHQSLTRAILTLAHGLSMTTIAEGVETESERELLEEMGCATAQGFLFARPMPADELRTMIGSTTMATSVAADTSPTV